MNTAIIIRYSEIYLKGKNRGFFERILFENMEKALKGIAHKLNRYSGRYLVEEYLEDDKDEIIERLKKVFGVHTISCAYVAYADMDEILKCCKMVCRPFGSFKVETKRADKRFPLNSMQISAEIGGKLLESNSNLCVDVHNPDFTVYIDVRENGTALVFSEFIHGAGGMPVGTSGKGLLLLSGGIDSPVAGHMMAKRGMRVDCVHFHSYPYTSEMAKDKVIRLAKKLSAYTGGIDLNIVKVTHIQESIHKNCKEEFMVAILRRFMMRIATALAEKNKDLCIITGESLGQVASQTIEGMTSTGEVTPLPILRPLCGFDKNEIIIRAKDMDTFETSIEPYEDCCTVFLPKHPVIHPTLKDIHEEEAKLDIEALVAEALKDVEVMHID